MQEHLDVAPRGVRKGYNAAAAGFAGQLQAVEDVTARKKWTSCLKAETLHLAPILLQDGPVHYVIRSSELETKSLHVGSIRIIR
jgi:hypothetical protein